MPRRQALARRSAAEWGIRAGLAIAATVLCGVCMARDAGYAMRSGDAARAYALAADDGRVAASYAQALSRADATSADRARADRLARRALRQDPTAVAAVSALGLNAQIRDDTAGARRLFAYAGRLSRRDLQTQIWAIEDAVARNDIPRALGHYDTALRTSRDAPTLLFPILAAAIINPPVRTALVATLARRPAPVWAPHFIGYAAGEGSEPRATARMFADLRGARVQVPTSASVALVDRLVGANLFAEAWSYYASLHPGVDRHKLRDPTFTGSGPALDLAGDTSTASVFDWRLVDTPGLTVSIQRGELGGVVDFTAPPGISGTLLRQAQMLPAGAYRLEGHANGIDQPEGALPYWVLACRDGRELGRVVVPPSRVAGGVFAGQMVVPADCPVQILSLVAHASDTMAGIAGQVDRVRILPLRPVS